MRWLLLPVLLGLVSGCAPPGDGAELQLQTTAVTLARELDDAGFTCLGPRQGTIVITGESRPGLARVRCLGTDAATITLYASRADLDADVARARQEQPAGVLAVSPGEPLSVLAPDRERLRDLAAAWRRELTVVTG